MDSCSGFYSWPVRRPADFGELYTTIESVPPRVSRLHSKSDATPGPTALLAILAAGLASGWPACRSADPRVPSCFRTVDLSRFMGDWYVIANIPTPFVKDAYNAVQNYSLNADGSVATTFTFREGGFDGKQKTLKPEGLRQRRPVRTPPGALQLRADPGGVPDRLRQPRLHRRPSSPATAATSSGSWRARPRSPTPSTTASSSKIGGWGYDTEKIQRVPQRW